MIITAIQKTIQGLKEPLQGHTSSFLLEELDSVLSALQGQKVEDETTTQKSVTLALFGQALGLQQASTLALINQLEDQQKQALALWLFYIFLYQLQISDNAKFNAVVTARGYLRIGYTR